MKRYRFVLGIVLIAIMESKSFKCNAQSQSPSLYYTPLDWENTIGFNASYDFSQEYFGSISCIATPYWGEGLYYHSFGIGFPRHYKNVRYDVSIPDRIITNLTVINGDTTEFKYIDIKRDTTIADYSFGYLYYEPGINIGRYITISCKVGLSLAGTMEVISGTPPYTSDITIITGSSSFHYNSSSSGTSSITRSELGIGLLLGPNIIGHIPISDNKRLVMNVGYNFFLPLTPLKVASKPNGLSVGLGVEWVLD